MTARICIDCAAEFDARRRHGGGRPRRCVPCSARWCRLRIIGRSITDDDVRAVKGLLPERMSAASVAGALGVPVRTLRHVEDEALRHFIAGMRIESNRSGHAE